MAAIPSIHAASSVRNPAADAHPFPPPSAANSTHACLLCLQGRGQGLDQGVGPDSKPRIRQDRLQGPRAIPDLPEPGAAIQHDHRVVTAPQ